MRNNHNDFILSPISKILEDAVSASSGAGCGIETYPLCDYLMQSIFIKMTGFQEQKLKCLCWELASEDYEYRYEKYSKNKVGEYSNYDDKRGMYKELIQQIQKRNLTFITLENETKSRILLNVTSKIQNIFADTNLKIWAQLSYNKYKELWGDVRKTHFATDASCLFTEINGGGMSLKNIYVKHLYVHRNRCAHNTLSYQQNLPTLKTLEDEGYKYENYFLWFSILVLIDEVFIELYKKYLNTIE